MKATGNDTLGTRSTMDVGGAKYGYYSLAKAAEKAKDKDSGLAAALTALTKGAGKYEGAG